MNAGLSNLATLKAQLLAVSLQANTSYDAIIKAIGLGVAAQIDKHCNRILMRTVGQVDTLRSDRRHWYLRNYPVEAITALAKKDSEADGYVAFPLPPNGSSLVQVMDLPRGYINFISIQGYFFSQLQITYNGGFWWPMLDVGDAGYPDAQPAGSYALPADIQLAWFLQCQEVWRQIDKLGSQIAENPEAQTSVGRIQLCDAARELLKGHIRYQIS